MNIDANFSLLELIGNVDLTKFYRYKGSLTTPTCNEAVVWTVFHEPIKVKKSLVSPKRLSLIGWYSILLFSLNTFGIFFLAPLIFSPNQNKKLWTEYHTHEDIGVRLFQKGLATKLDTFRGLWSHRVLWNVIQHDTMALALRLSHYTPKSQYPHLSWQCNATQQRNNTC